MKKTLCVIAMTAIMLTAPVLIPAVDAEQNTIRMSNVYVEYSLFQYVEGMNLDNGSFIYLKGSNPNLSTMIDYVNGKDVDIPVSYENDDRDAKFDNGESLYVFRTTSSIQGYIPIIVQGEDEPIIGPTLSVRAPYSGGLFVKAGDHYSIRVLSAVDNYGDSVSCYIVEGNKQVFLNETYNGYSATTTEFIMNTMKDGPSSFYVDVTYEGEGFSTPNGSPVVFATICAVITIGVMLLMFYAGRRPKWSS